MYRQCGFKTMDDVPEQRKDIVSIVLNQFRSFHPIDESSYGIIVDTPQPSSGPFDTIESYESFMYDYITEDDVKSIKDVRDELFRTVNIHCIVYKSQYEQLHMRLPPPYLEALINVLSKADKCYVNVPYAYKVYRVPNKDMFSDEPASVETYVGTIDIVIKRETLYYLLNIVIVNNENDAPENSAVNTCKRYGFQQMMGLTYLPIIYDILVICNKKNCVIKLPVKLL